MTDLPALAASLRALLGPGIGVGVSDPGRDGHDLWPGEARAVARARKKRRLEFAAGRHAARAAMAQIGIAPGPVPQAPDRAPVWPPGVTGSIAHCDNACIAAVAPLTRLASLGVDIERATPLENDLQPLICTPRETGWLETRPANARARLAKLIFCAKESLYKAQYPQSRTLIGYDAVEITVATELDRFRATFTRDVGPFAAGTTLNGGIAQTQGLLICVLLLSHGYKGGTI